MHFLFFFTFGINSKEDLKKNYKQSDVIIIFIAGGSGSGKTAIANMIKENLNGDAVIFNQDSYYKHFPKLSLIERSKINFDHPDSLDIELFIHHLK